MSERVDWTPVPGSPGFYYDDTGTLHLDEDEAIRGAGYEPTEENRRVLRAAAIELAERIGIDWTLRE